MKMKATRTIWIDDEIWDGKSYTWRVQLLTDDNWHICYDQFAHRTKAQATARMAEIKELTQGAINENKNPI